MLQSLQIRNYAIIESVDIQFDSKLNIITGETGAGKSIVMGALGLILGERADTKILYTPEDKCVVEGVFDIGAYKLNAFFEANELDYDHSCIVRREIAPNGKSRAFVNDTPVTVSLLKELGSQLIDIVSQHQTLELNDEGFQLNLIDAIAENGEALQAYEVQYKRFKQLEKELKNLQERETKARADEDYIRYQLTELTEANVQADEQLRLEQQLDVLSNAEKIQQAASSAAHALNESEQSIADGLQQIKATLLPSAKHHQGIASLLTRFESAVIELTDIAAELETIAENTHADPAMLLQTEDRLQVLVALQKKHRVLNNAELLEVQAQLEQQLAGLGSLQTAILELEQQLKTNEQDLVKRAQALSNKRKQTIPYIEKEIHQLFEQVEMPDARIQIVHEQLTALGSSGTDSIQLLFAANKGQSFQPIRKVASGGELSRLMLCIKSLIANKVALPSIVFDEIDTGISGEAAIKVSKVMKSHAAHHQVIAITHLPQIAGKADAHFFVSKTSEADKTTTQIRRLNQQERLSEIARMLHGANPSPKVLAAAKELIA
ncbi:MAG: DNA repair protein RecN [Bacteroidia bacterium]|jgi:DNA repair protein RecN (Recombination protein N)|nr:DNA repair protein RecN [Bacteroidia bacterium]